MRFERYVRVFQKKSRLWIWKRRHNKIFCIGLHKTGTSSLHQAFKILGFESVHYVSDAGKIQEIVYENYKNGKRLLTGIEHFDCYSDWSRRETSLLFKQLDREHPDSKFILNTRDMSEWIESRKKHIFKIPNLDELRKKMPHNDYYNFNVPAWIKEYEKLHSEVMAHFKNRTDDLVVFNIAKGDGWKKLCEFLSLPIPRCDFPHVNKAKKI